MTTEDATCATCGQPVKHIGQLTEDDLRAQGVAEIVIKAAKAQSEALQRAMSPPGDLGLPDLLDARRLEYGIPDVAFSRQAAFDRVLVWQLPPEEFSAGTFGDTSIVAPETTIDREQREAPRGILVSAGLRALDELRSNGIDLGHVITFLRIVPWRLRVGVIAAQRVELLILNSGDIVASTDLRANLRSGSVQIVQQDVDGTTCHTLTGHGLPVDAHTPGEY